MAQVADKVRLSFKALKPEVTPTSDNGKVDCNYNYLDTLSTSYDNDLFS